jgi:Anti-sigma-K factor rskA/Sigma-70, region 4
MSPLDTLAPDQRAVLELVLRQGRSYGELSELLEIPERDVRARADAGLRALAGEPGASVDSGRIADWLLGQQPDAEAERTRAAVARSAPAREWAAVAAERLREMGGAAVPAVPQAGDAPPAPRPRPLRDEAARPRPVDPRRPPDASRDSSRLGGAVLIGVLAVVVAVFLVWFLGRDDEEEPSQAAGPQQEQQQQQQEGPAPQPTGNDVELTGTGGSEARGLMRLFTREDGTVQFLLAAENVPPNEGEEVYAVWFTREGGKPRRLGFAQTQVGEDGVLTTGGPQQGDEDRFPRWFATYETVLVTREADAQATEPGEAVLEGTLPSGG